MTLIIFLKEKLKLNNGLHKTGQKIGQKLIESVYEEANNFGAPSVYWLTQEFNRLARKLYDKIADLTPFIKYARRNK